MAEHAHDSRKCNRLGLPDEQREDNDSAHQVVDEEEDRVAHGRVRLWLQALAPNRRRDIQYVNPPLERDDLKQDEKRLPERIERERGRRCGVSPDARYKISDVECREVRSVEGVAGGILADTVADAVDTGVVAFVRDAIEDVQTPDGVGNHV